MSKTLQGYCTKLNKTKQIEAPTVSSHGQTTNIVRLCINDRKDDFHKKRKLTLVDHWLQCSFVRWLTAHSLINSSYFDWQFVLWFTGCSRQMDVVVVLDMSGSNEEIFDAMFEFTRILTLGLPVGSGSTQVAVVRYSDSANVTFHLDKYSTGQQVRIYLR